MKNKKNLAIICAVCLICIAFVVSALKDDRTVVTQEVTSIEETEAVSEIAETSEAETAPEKEEPVRIFSRPASSLKEITGDEKEEYVPAAYRLNLAYFYPEDADTSDTIHSYAGKIFQTLNTLNADYLANYYDMSDMTPLSFANRQGQGVSRIMGKYNPQDSRHDPKDSSTWKINSFKNVTVNFYDGDGNRINGYYAVQEIMSMASVYAYYHDMNDAEAMEAYCRELFKNAMSSRVSMGNVYYDSGCLNRTKQDEAAEAIAMEAQQMATEHQLAGATAISAGLLTAKPGEASETAQNEEGSAETSADGTNETDSAQTDAASSESSSSVSSAGTGTITSAGQTSHTENMDEQVVISHAVESTTAATEESYAVINSGTVNGSGNSYAVYDGSSLGGTAYSDATVIQDSDPGEVVSGGTEENSGDSTSSEEAVEAIPDPAPETDSEISAAPLEDPYAGEDLVVSPALNLRSFFRFLRRPFLQTAASGLTAPVFRAADEDLVVSPAITAVPEAPAPETAAASENTAVLEEPAQQAETAAPVQEAETQAIPDEGSGSSETVSSGGSSEDTTAVTSNASAPASENYGYAVVGSNGNVYQSQSMNSGASETLPPETEAEELSEEELAIAAQINDLLAQANVLSGADSYCPGHIDLYITITIKGIDDRNGLFKADKIGNDKANFNDRWQGWTTDKIAEAKALNHLDWFETYGLSISSINLTSQLTEEEIQNYLETLPEDISETRKAVVDFALHSVGKVPYYWGGKPNGPGYENNNFYTLVGADYHGRILRGLDCSGWINWVYWSATGKSLAGESTGSLIGCGKRINRSALRPGDIIIRTGADSHVVMFLGWVGNGNFIGIHETGGVKNNVVVGEMTASWPYYRSLLD